MTDEELKESEEENKLVQEIKESGHTYHCACRQVWGDGECECKGESDRLRAMIDKTLAQGSVGG